MIQILFLIDLNKTQIHVLNLLSKLALLIKQKQLLQNLVCYKVILNAGEAKFVHLINYVEMNRDTEWNNL